MRVIDVLGLFCWHAIHGCLYNQALADVRSTGVGIKCRYCRSWTPSPIVMIIGECHIRNVLYVSGVKRTPFPLPLKNSVSDIELSQLCGGNKQLFCHFVTLSCPYGRAVLREWQGDFFFQYGNIIIFTPSAISRLNCAFPDSWVV